MIYIFEDAVFAKQDYDLFLYGFLEDASAGRLYISVTDETGVSYNQWRSRIPGTLLALWDTMIDWTAADSAIFRQKIIIVSRVDESKWGEQPILNIDEARELARNGLVLFIENGRNDRNFILSMADKSTRNLLLKLEKKRALHFSGVGGIGEIKVQLEDIIAKKSNRTHCYSVLIDSDAEVPGSMSAAAASILTICARLQIVCHCLERRAIENYIPIGAIFDFINNSNKNYRGYLRDLGNALKKTSLQQRAHFPMKAGLKVRSAAQNVFYGNLDAQTLGYLKRRFPDKMASTIFTEAPSQRLEQQLESETARREVQTMILKVLEYARGPHA